MASPTSRTMDLLRREGYFCKIVERWNPYAKVRIDLWGADILSFRLGHPVLLIQCTTQSNAAARIHKVCAIPEVKCWVQNGGSFQVWGWRKLKKGKRHLWEVDKRPITLEMIDQHVRIIAVEGVPDNGPRSEDVDPA